jgi:hypothetical protein
MENKQAKEKIILAITPDMEIYKCIVDNLNYLNYDVYLLSENHDFKYKNLKDRVINFYKKKILKDKTYKRVLRRKYFKEEHNKKLLTFPDTEYSITIRADLFEDITLKKITSKSSKSYSYQWDGLSRFPEVKNTIRLFDKFYVFDKKDLTINPKTFPTTNFYFDCYQTLLKNENPEYDAYFIGSYDSRIDTLLQICEFLYSHNFKLNIILFCKPKKHLKKYSYIRFINRPLNYLENLKMVANSKMVIDIHHPNLHSGLSFRTFEALGYNKKLITSNSIIKDYDFYNDQNIYIIDNNNNNFEKFLDSNYQEVPLEIKNKYSFTNWINYTLEKDNFTTINIP